MGYDRVLFYIRDYKRTEGTYPVLSKVDCRKAALADFLSSSELADNLIWFLFKTRRRWRATAYGSRRCSWCRHGCCAGCVTASFGFSSISMAHGWLARRLQDSPQIGRFQCAHRWCSVYRLLQGRVLSRWLVAVAVDPETLVGRFDKWDG